jgi:Ca2+-binding RTX toxin-like protein
VQTDDHSVVDAGAGDDTIQVRSSSTVTGGAGNDSISVSGEGTTVNFAIGDGNDVIDLNGHTVDFAINGYSLNDVIVTQQSGKAIVTFKGSGDSLTFDLGGAGSARLSFAGSASVDIKA